MSNLHISKTSCIQEELSSLREQTGILDTKVLNQLRGRIVVYGSRKSLDFEAARSIVMKPVSYEDFMAVIKGRFIDESGTNKMYYQHPFCTDNKNLTAQSPTDGRFDGTFYSSGQIDFPVDADQRIWIYATNKDDTCSRSWAFSYNELIGLGGGRNSHWSERSPSDQLYRKTPVGQKTVGDLITVGTVLRGGYGGMDDFEYVVVSEPSMYVYKPKERPDEEKHYFPNYSLSLMKMDNSGGLYNMNELVAEDGELQYLFYGRDSRNIKIVGHEPNWEELTRKKAKKKTTQKIVSASAENKTFMEENEDEHDEGSLFCDDFEDTAVFYNQTTFGEQGVLF